MRKRLSGDTILGSSTAAISADHWRRLNPTTFIHGEPPDGCSVPFLGTYSRASSSSSASSNTIDPPTPPTDPRARHNTKIPPFLNQKLTPRCSQRGIDEFIYFNSAPLENVVAAEMFYLPGPPRVNSIWYQGGPSTIPQESPTPDNGAQTQASEDSAQEEQKEDESLEEDNLICQGIILHYSNGGSRALGQIRMGVYASKTVQNPTHVCYGHEWTRRKQLHVQFVSDSEHKRHNSWIGYKCHRMRGELWYWFNDDESCALVKHGDIWG